MRWKGHKIGTTANTLQFRIISWTLWENINNISTGSFQEIEAFRILRTDVSIIHNITEEATSCKRSSNMRETICNGLA